MTWTRSTSALAVAAALLTGGCATLSGDGPTFTELVADRAQFADTDRTTLSNQGWFDFTTPLTLEEAINYGLTHNLALRLQSFEDDLTDQAAIDARLGLLPSVNISGNITGRSVDRDDAPVIDNAGGAVIGNVARPTLSSGIDAEVTVDVMDYLMRIISLKETDLVAQQRYLARFRETQRFKMDIVNAYFNAVRTRQSLQFAERTFAATANSIERYGEQWQPLERKDAELALHRLRTRIHQLGVEQRETMGRLRELLGLLPNNPLPLADTSVEAFIARFIAPDEINVDALERFALRSRTELFAQDLELHVQREQARRTLLSLFPGVGLFVGGRVAGSLDGSNVRERWLGASLGLTWQLSQLPARIAELRRSNRHAEAAELQRRLLTMGVITQVHLGTVEYGDAFDRYLLSRETVRLTREVYELTLRKDALERTISSDTNRRFLQAFDAQLNYWRDAETVIANYGRLLFSSGFEVGADYRVLAIAADDAPTVATDMPSDEAPVADEAPEEAPVAANSDDSDIEAIMRDMAATPVTTTPAAPAPATTNDTPVADTPPAVVESVTTVPDDEQLHNAIAVLQDAVETLDDEQNRRTVADVAQTRGGRNIPLDKPPRPETIDEVFAQLVQQPIVADDADTTVGDGDYYVQLGAFRTRRLAVEFINGLPEAIIAPLAPYNGEITESPRRDGVIFRVRYGPYTRTDAERVCRTWRQQNNACWLIRPDGSQ